MAVGTIRRLSGVLAPSTTPFAADTEVDDSDLAWRVARHAAGGLKGCLALGSNGEGAS